MHSSYPSCTCPLSPSFTLLFFIETWKPTSGAGSCHCSFTGAGYTHSLRSPFDECARQAISSSQDKISSSLYLLFPRVAHEGLVAQSQRYFVLWSLFQCSKSEDDFTFLLVNTFPHKYDRTGGALLLTAFPAVLLRPDQQNLLFLPCRQTGEPWSLRWRSSLQNKAYSMPEDGQESLAG